MRPGPEGERAELERDGKEAATGHLLGSLLRPVPPRITPLKYKFLLIPVSCWFSKNNSNNNEQQRQRWWWNNNSSKEEFISLFLFLFSFPSETFTNYTELLGSNGNSKFWWLDKGQYSSGATKWDHFLYHWQKRQIPIRVLISVTNTSFTFQSPC